MRLKGRGLDCVGVCELDKDFSFFVFREILEGFE